MREYKIHIFGASGSGTSTLGQSLALALNCRWIDTDSVYWRPTNPPYTDARPRPERLALLKQQLNEQHNYILSGSLCRWADSIKGELTLAIFLQVPTLIRLQRLRERESAQFGDRIKPNGDMAQIYSDFLIWAAQYDTADESMRSLRQHQAWIKTLTCPILELDQTQTSASLEKLTQVVRSYMNVLALKANLQAME